ncbi:hypothetical protein SLS57_009041 [Botryosphaeria dothidea]
MPCDALKAAGFGDRVLYSGQQNYEDRINSYWSVTAQLRPQCLLQPTNADEVSLVVNTLVSTNSSVEQGCQFAVRSGGHTERPGAANIEDGVTVDLGLMNATVYNSENGSASVQPGARWASVYKALEEHDVAVAGGRSATVGVGGFVLGGGISFWSMRQGWVCDNVKNFEVVLASGEIVNANKHTNTDLFKVLKGGSNNFGIVTRIDLPTFEQQKLWGGHVTYPFSTAPQQLRALVGFVNDLDHDSDAAAIVSLWYSSKQGRKFVTNSYEYTKPVERPAIFQNFLAVPGNLSDSTRFTYVRGLAEQFEEKLGLCNSFTTLTFQNDERVLSKDQSKKDMFQAAASQFVSDIEEFALSIGKDSPFKYLNYAHQDQNPLATYGAENIAKMHAASAKYDPKGIFQTMVSGGFKVSKVHEGGPYHVFSDGEL